MKLVLPGLLRDELIPRIEAVAPQATIVWYDQHGEPEAPIADADVLLRWFFTAEQLARLVRQMPALRWLHIPRAGVDGSLIPEIVERDIIVTNPLACMPSRSANLSCSSPSAMSSKPLACTSCKPRTSGASKTCNCASWPARRC